MKLCFSWMEREGKLSPDCTSDIVNIDGVSPLCCLLTDDGGQGFLDAIPWLNEGLNIARSMEVHLGGVVDWSRDSWGGKFAGGEVKIYSLHDEKYFELINNKFFYIVLSEWINFIETEPNSRAEKVVEF